MKKELPPQYNPKEVEGTIYEKWEKSGFFNPDNLPGGEPYSVIMPPPNVTGTLHVGHALMLVVQDILIRWNRMRGKKTLWLPGTDHAAIATQAKVEEMLYKGEGKTRFDFGREEFLRVVERFAQESHDKIVGQIKRMGSSCDWSREAFTLDKKRTLAVETAFKRMYEGGLIFRGERIVNWDPKLKTTVSDDEIEWKEEKAPFYYLKYGPFVIGTARPETKFGDKYLVAHPEDPRYKKYKHGEKFEVDWINGKIMATVIKDEAADMDFGTGAMTITPAHDFTDFEIAKRHKLEIEQIIDFDGKLKAIAGEFEGEHIKKARPLIVEKLKNKGLLDRVDENYVHRIAVNSRGGGVIEPQIKEQWFMDVGKKFKVLRRRRIRPWRKSSPPKADPPLAEKFKTIKNGEEASLKDLMRRAVESDEIEILPEHFKKTYFHWIDNLRDWCISRQIWYGHRIPVWYNKNSKLKVQNSKLEEENKEIYVGVEPPEGEGWEQDPDTLDTWFSSALWTFSTLGWPEETEDLKMFHPTTVMETGYDILFFWVARMILMSTYLLGEVPFRMAYLHGLVRDKDKQKMSKSKGNVIDPLGVIDIYGTDALRFALVFATGQGADVALSEDRIRGMKYFTNKLWNIARFVLTNVSGEKIPGSAPMAKTEADKKILSRFANTYEEVNKNLESFALHGAAQAIYQFVWSDFADFYIEESKVQLKDEALRENTEEILLYCLAGILKMLHPFMPFVTEEIWGRLKPGEILMVQKWEG